MDVQQHTPGPWSPAMMNSRQVCCTPDRRGFYRALILELASGKTEIIGEARGATEAEAIANARLIAAGPDLYEAALAAKDILRPCLDEPLRTAFWKLSDAIARVRLSQPPEHG